MNHLSSSVSPPPEKPEGLRILDQTADFCCASLHNCVAIVWNYPPVPDTIERSLRAVGGVITACPEGTGIISVSRLRGSGDEAAAADAHIDRQLLAWGPAVVAVANVVGGNDLFSRIDRLGQRVAHRLAGSSRKGFFGDCESACAWLTAAVRERTSSPEAAELSSSLAWLLDYYRAPGA